MDLLFTTFILLSVASWLDLRRAGKPDRPPPGPTILAIIRTILELGWQPHRALARLAQAHGPIMLLKLGTLTSVVISSPEAARTVLQDHDHACCTRTYPEAVRALDHHLHSVACMPADNRWRIIRKICKEKMFAVQRLDSSQALRTAKLRDLIDYVRQCAAAGEAVDIGKTAFTASLNLMSASLFSVDIAEFGSDCSSEFRDIVAGIMETVAKPNLTDYFPILRVIDPQGVYRESVDYFRKCFAIFDEIIVKRLQERKERGSADAAAASGTDMLESLLDLRMEDGSELSLEAIRHLLLDLFVAGSDTTSGTIEWAMTELLSNPEKMLKAKHEINNIIGCNQVQESDISKLPYLQAIVKETFRLHPVVPLLVPRKAKEDIVIGGYIIPQNARILINAWAIGRNPNVWQDCEKFTPERFLDMEIGYQGRHFELLPFGGGRRICLGLPLARRMVLMTLATLISNFDWKLKTRLKCEEINMDEKFGLSLQKTIPLIAIPINL